MAVTGLVFQWHWGRGSTAGQAASSPPILPGCVSKARDSVQLLPTPHIESNLFLKIELYSYTVTKLQWGIFMLNNIEMHVLFSYLSWLPCERGPRSRCYYGLFSSIFFILDGNARKLREGVIYPNQNWIKSRLCLWWVCRVFLLIYFIQGKVHDHRDLDASVSFWLNWILCFYK